MRVLRSFAVLTASLAALASFGCQEQVKFLKARNELNKGVQAFSAANYESAAQRFQNALELDPELTDARAYQAYAYMSQYVPGSETPENLRMAQQALDGFQEVLDTDPENMLAVSSMASLYFNMREFDEAEKWHRRRIELAMAMDPPDPGAADSYYTIGVIKWTQEYQTRSAARAAMGMQAGDPGPLIHEDGRRALAEESLPLIEQGMEALDSALEVDPNYVDAMVYLNLLERAEADFAESSEEYEEHIARADELVEQAMETKRRLAEESTTEQFAAE